jgi:hypothetical protein
LGAGLIDPGRNGRGPDTVLEPGFVNVLVPAVDLRLQNTIFEFHTCEDGIEAIPPSDPCERAKKQYTALLLNLESGRLQEDCFIDLQEQGCSSINVSELVNEVASLINSMDRSSCNQASACAGAINENEGIREVDSSFAPSTCSQDTGSDAGNTEPTESDLAPINPQTGTGKSQAVFSGPTVTPTAADPDLARSQGTTGPDPVPTMLVTLSIPKAQNERGGDSPDAPSADIEGRPRESEATLDEHETIERHLGVLANSSSSEEARKRSEDALLTALGGGYDPEVRLRIVRGLLGKIDVAYQSLLVNSLEDVRIEAEETGNTEVAKEAAGLLKNLQSSRESSE